MKKRTYQDYIGDIVDSITDIENFTKGLDFKAFREDKKTVNAVVRSIEIIGEATKNIPRTLRDKHPAIPWGKMAGMRNRLIHEYFGIDTEILWKTVKEDIPGLKKEIKKLKI